MSAVVVTLKRESAWLIADQIKDAREANRLDPDAKHTEDKLREALQATSANPVDIMLSQEDINNILQTMGSISPIIGLGYRLNDNSSMPKLDSDGDPGEHARRVTLEMSKDRSHFD